MRINKNIKKMIKIIKAFDEGAQIQSRHYIKQNQEFKNDNCPSWDFSLIEYRIKPDLKPLMIEVDYDGDGTFHITCDSTYNFERLKKMTNNELVKFIQFIEE